MRRLRHVLGSWLLVLGGDALTNDQRPTTNNERAATTAWKIGGVLLPLVLAEVGKAYSGYAGAALISAGWVLGGLWVWLWFFVRR
jgi:hypothetical protein